MRIIGLTGAAGAGKDTVCGFALEWCEEEGLRAERLAFADPLKRSAAAALGFATGGETGRPVSEAVEFCNDIKQPGVEVVVVQYGEEEIPDAGIPGGAKQLTSEVLTKITGREFLQFYGTEAHRDVFGPEFWVEVTERKLAERAGSDLDVVFLTDPRFANEARMIHKHEGEVWEVVRPGQTKVEAHASEAGLPEGAIEFQIVNDGSLDDLRALVRAVCDSNLETVA